MTYTKNVHELEEEIARKAYGMGIKSMGSPCSIKQTGLKQCNQNLQHCTTKRKTTLKLLLLWSFSTDMLPSQY